MLPTTGPRACRVRCRDRSPVVSGVYVPHVAEQNRTEEWREKDHKSLPQRSNGSMEDIKWFQRLPFFLLGPQGLLHSIPQYGTQLDSAACCTLGTAATPRRMYVHTVRTDGKRRGRMIGGVSAPHRRRRDAGAGEISRAKTSLPLSFEASVRPQEAPSPPVCESVPDASME